MHNPTTLSTKLKTAYVKVSCNYVLQPLKVSMEGKTHKQTIMGSCCTNVNGGKKREGLHSDSDSAILELQSASKYLKFNYVVGATLSRKEKPERHTKFDLRSAASYNVQQICLLEAYGILDP
ncbi:hypothetical protein L6164_032754 [Bauhinia variegata]|uniref:Uncharacterized protein n=1 Tax=Bauhinia variegata TaxID=167791 RepID=A0ACB9KQ17_BAUVA|nr:hypothetical protein L6164_032754 [Bauhinia variegata]